jgi:hypothetical protein
MAYKYLQETDFVTRVRNRDKCCCMTGQLVAAEDFTGFDSAHIFPLSETDIVRCVPRTHINCVLISLT